MSKPAAGAAAKVAKAVKAVVKLQVPACKAAPSPAIGQALGALGVNMMEFCKAFNKRTEAFKDNTLLPVILTAYTDRSFEFVTKTPPVSWFIKQACGLELGSGLTGKEVIGEVSVLQVYELARLKQKDDSLQHVPVESIARSIVGTCRSMGISVINLKERAAQEEMALLEKKKEEENRKEEKLYLY